jgi:hypothetical protein
MEGPIDARLTVYGSTGNRTASGAWPDAGDATFENPTTLAVAGQVIGGKRYWSIPQDTKILIENYGWGIVKDICPECTPGTRPWAGIGLGTGINQRFGDVRIDVYGAKQDMGIRQIWIYQP